MASKVFSLGPIAVTTPGTAVPLSATELFSSKVWIFSDLSNKQDVFIGDSTVSETNGVRLPPGDHIILETSQQGRYQDQLKIQDIFIDASRADDNVRVLYLGRA